MEQYPTEDELAKITNWKVAEDTFHEFMVFVKSIWWMPEWGWHEENGVYKSLLAVGVVTKTLFKLCVIINFSG